MTRYACALTILILALGQSGAVGFTRDQQSATAAPQIMQLQSLVPADALGLVEVENMAALKDALLQTRFYRLVRSSAPDSPLSHYLQDVVDPIAPTGRRLAFVFFDRPGSSLSFPSAALVAEIGDALLLESALQRFEEKYAAFKPVTTERKNGKIVTIDHLFAGEKLSLARAEKFLILGHALSVERIVDGIGVKPSLADLPFYRAAAEKPSAGPLRGFVNLEKLSNYLVTLLAANPGPGGVSLLVPALQFAGISALKAATFTTGFGGGAVTDEFHIVVDMQRKNPITALLDIPVIPFAALGSIPEDAVLSLISGINLNQLYDALLMTLGPLIRMQLGGQTAEDAIRKLEDDLGFRIRTELIASLGNEFVLAYIPRMGTPSPDLERVIVLTVTNPRTLSTVAEKIHQRMKNQGGLAEPVTYKSATIYPVDSTLSVVVLKDVVVIASTEAAKRVIDVRETGRTLGRSPALANHLPSPSTAGLALYLSPAIFRMAAVRSLLGAVPPTDPLLRALESEWSSPIFGLGRKEPTGLELKITSPWGVLGTLDLLAARRSQDRSPTSADASDRSIDSYLRLLAEMNALLTPTPKPRR